MNRTLVFATGEWVGFCFFFLDTEHYVAALFILMKHSRAVNDRDSFGVVASSPARGEKVQTVQVR